MSNGLTVARATHRLLSAQCQYFIAFSSKSSFGGMPCYYFGLCFDDFANSSSKALTIRPWSCWRWLRSSVP